MNEENSKSFNLSSNSRIGMILVVIVDMRLELQIRMENQVLLLQLNQVNILR
jgi:hypothetical protein